jgi:hypothetical protein
LSCPFLEESTSKPAFFNSCSACACIFPTTFGTDISGAETCISHFSVGAVVTSCFGDHLAFSSVSSLTPNTLFSFSPQNSVASLPLSLHTSHELCPVHVPGSESLLKISE